MKMKTLSMALILNLKVVVACDFEASIHTFHNKQFEQSVVMFQDCITSEQHGTESQFYLGIIHRELRDLKQSALFLKQAVSDDPENINYQLEYAVTLERSGELQQALELYQTVLLQEPHVGAGLGEARMYHWMGQFKKSTQLYQQLQTQHPGHTGVELGLAFVLLANRNKQAASAVFNQILQREADNADALKGLEMVAALSNHTIQVNRQAGKGSNGSNRGFTVNYQGRPNAAVHWGVGFAEANNALELPQENGVPVNRATKSSANAFINYKINPKHSMLLGLTRERLQEDQYQSKVKLESTHRLNDRSTVFLGVVKSRANGVNTNTLSYAGWVYQRSRRISLVTQAFYGADTEFQDSQAISVGVIKNRPNGGLWHTGLSVSKTGENNTTTGFIRTEIPVSEKTDLTFSAVKNFSNNDASLNAGFRYEF